MNTMRLFQDLPIRKALWLLLISICMGGVLVFAVIHKMVALGYLSFFMGLHTLAYFSLKYKAHF